MKSTKKKMSIKQAIGMVAVGPGRSKDITENAAYEIMQQILSGDIDEIQAAVFLIALRMKGESLAELKGMFEAIQPSPTGLAVDHPKLHCIAEPFNGYDRYMSLSPFLPCVLAACGVPTLIHGVADLGPKFGLTPGAVFHGAGINTNIQLEDAREAINQYGWAYIDQSVYAPQLAKLIPLRNKIIKRTALHTIERLLLPIRGAKSTKLVLGYVHKAYPSLYYELAMLAGYDECLLIKGVEGGVLPALNKPLRFWHGSREGFEKNDYEHSFISNATFAAIKMDSDSNREEKQTGVLSAGVQVLSGERGWHRNSLVLAASTILCQNDQQLSVGAAVEKVKECLDNGNAMWHFQKVVDFCRVD